MEKEIKGYYNSKAGLIEIICTDRYLISVRFVKPTIKYRNPKSLVLKETIKQLKEYFAGKLKNFRLLILLNGTEFQKKVWKEILKIEYGHINSYKNIAIAIGSPKSSRAVGNASGQNKLAIIIPCHRVIHKDNSLSGYAYGTRIKKHLINLENKTLNKILK